ncbi:hypothetical protein ABH923_001737 [Leifsonia sp. EB41]
MYTPVSAARQESRIGSVFPGVILYRWEVGS